MASLTSQAQKSKHLAACLQMLFDIKKLRTEAMPKNESGKSTTVDAVHENMRQQHFAKSFEPTIAAAADSYSRALDAGFTNSIMEVLPQELRDMINEYLLDSLLTAMSHRMAPVYLFSLKAGYTSWSDAGDVPLVTKMDHYLKPEYVGMAFASELSAVFLAKRTFELFHQASLPQFLKSNFIGTTSQPSRHIISPTVRVRMDRCNGAIGSIRAWSSPKYREPILRHYQEAIKHFDSLKLVPIRRCSILRLVFGDMQPRSLKLAQALVPFVFDMKDKGWSVIVVGSDISYDMSREEWNDKVAENDQFANEDPSLLTKGRYRMY